MENIDTLNVVKLVDSLIVKRIDSLNVVVQQPSEVLSVAVKHHPFGGFPEYSIGMHPLLSGLAATLLALLLIPWFLKRRERKQQKIQDVIKVTDEVNVALSCLFWKIRNPNSSMKIVNDALMKAFESRIRIGVMAKTHFPKKNFAKEYNEIILELNYLRLSISEYEKEKWMFDEKALEKHISILKGNWKIPDKKNKEEKNDDESVKSSDLRIIEDSKKLTYPYNIYFNWNQVIWDKFESFIYKYLKIKARWYQVIWDRTKSFIYKRLKIKARPVKPLEQEKRKKGEKE